MKKNHPSKIVLVSGRPYDRARDESLLLELIEARVRLFCAVGPCAAEWEDAMDWLGIGLGEEDSHFVVTTAHSDESVEEVIAFAEYFSLSEVGSVEVIYAPD
jgi:hypothetical protein